MNCAVEERINRTQGEHALVQDTKKEMVKIEERPKLNNDESKSSISELFPWIIEFRKMCRCMHTDKSMASLTELMQFYARNVSISVNECYTRPLRAAKLKDFISETLLLFLYICRELSEDCNKSIYLNNMSDLLALYIDMELKASRKSREDHDKICARLTSCLYVYLEHSTEHLLDTLMKIQLMCRNYHQILDPIITKIMRNIPMHPESSVMYIRYFLIYRLWRKINGDVAVRNQIMAAAIASLGPLPSTFSSCILEDVLPKVPKSQPNSTKALLQHKFDVKKHCELFVQYCKESDGNSVCQKKDGPATPIDSSSRINSQMQPEDIAHKSIERIDDNVKSIISDKIRQNESISLLKPFKSLNLDGQTSFKCLGTFPNNISTKHAIPKTIKSNKNRMRRKCKKSNEIVIIDLTSDVVLEKCIKKRKSRKLPWLEEAKKRIDLKIVKASRKSKNKNKAEENIGETHSSNSSRSVSRHVEDNTQMVNAAGSSSPKNNSNVCPAVDDKQNENEMVIDDELLEYTETGRKPIGAEVNTKEINIKVSNTALPSTMTMKSHLAEILPPTKQDFTVDGKRFGNDTVPRTKSDEKENDRCNKQTVIKRLIETDIFSEPEARKRAESLKKVCDLGAECPSVNSTAICTQYDSKDNAINSNRSNLNVINDKITERVTSSIIIMKHERNGHGVSTYEALDNTRSNESACTPDYSRETADSAASRGELDLAHNDDKGGTNFNETAEHAEIPPSKGLSRYDEKLQVPQAALKNSVTRDKVEPRTEGESSKCTNTMVDDRRNKELRAQTELEICNYDEANKGIKDDKSRIANIRESIFGSCSMDKKDISNTVNVTCPRENIENNENSRIDTNVKKPVEDVASGNNYNGPVDKTNVPLVSHLCPGVISKRESSDDLYKSADKEACSVAGSKYIVQDSDLQDNIDGLSLLASVSQHVPHLKPESEVKCDQIKVKDYASLRYACCNQTTDDETDTNDSSNTVSQLLENPSTDIINRIVGIYPEDALDKVALHVEVTSNDAESGNTDNELCKVVSYPEANVNYDADTLAHNLLPIESNMQTVKENTNVILNGETVVLLQKSPNSNLYIINKAVENSKDHSNDDEISRLKEKNWVSSAEVCGQFEAVASLDHASYNLELTAYSTELPYQESKCSVGRGKGIKVEPEESNFSEAKSYSKKVAHSADMLSVNSQMYQDVNVMSKPMDKRKPNKPNLSFRQNIKQEFNNISNHIAASNCAIPGCNVIHSHPHEVDGQHPLHIPASHPTTLPPIYGNCAGNGDLCVPYHKHCTPVSCSLQINATTPLHSRAKSGSPCGRSHCSCLNCTYDIVAHCRQCIHPTTDTHVSCIESSPYFLPTHSSVQSPAVQEHDRAKSEAVIGKLYDDQLLCKIEKSLLQGSSIEKLDAQRDTEKLYKEDADNKLPLKKRLKAHAMAYGELPIKAEKVNNYPAVPMMSIAALEALDGQQKRSGQIGRAEYELSPGNKEELTRDVYHCGSNLVRRDYYKDVHVSGSHQSIAKESTRKLERQFRSANDQSSNTVCQESCLQRAFKTPAQRKEINAASLKRFGAETMGQEGTFKKVKKTQLPLRQTRSSKRNVPKVNYSYTDVDPEWNPSGESKRKRKKTSR